MISKRFLVTIAFSLLFMGMRAGAQLASPSTEQCLGGQLDAPIRIETFSDFQCPACRALYLDTMKPVLQDYASRDKVCVIYREFPLPIHQFSRQAARYSKASQKLGHRQWAAVVDALYTDQPRWSNDGSVELTVAKALSAEDFEKVKKLLQDPSLNEAIDKEIALGQKREVQSTPTFFVTAVGREQRVVGGIPYPVLKDFFDKIVK